MKLAKYFVTIVLSFVLSSAALCADLETLISQKSEEIEAEVIKLRRHFHENPELSNREIETAKTVAAYLKDLGMEIETGIAYTGVVGILKGGKPGKVVALRADMDALPVTEQTGLSFASTKRTQYNGKEVGVMHACGHDAHMAILLGTAKVLASMQEHIPGTIKFIFQPAEEGAPPEEGGGAAMMIEEGVLAGEYAPEAIFGLHVWPYKSGDILYRPKGAMAAVDTFFVEVTGKQTHGSSPWLGVDPIVAASQIVSAIQTIPSRQLDITAAPSVITVGTIEGGLRHNIISDKVTMSGTIRTFDKGVRKELLKRLKSTVETAASLTGAKADFKVISATLVTYNDEALTQQMLPTMQKVVGEEHVRHNSVIMAGEDFSYFQDKIPGLYFMLGIGADGVPEEEMKTNHSPDFYVNEKALKTGVKVMSSLAVDYLESASQ
ncbi:amidohydrolase [Aliiglaciecola sp. 3_MG-2023]|uniref:amidohydrolase n=1 Tax=Aliiglaciecola sp. 3_MG-2023 TaxID=3062644 RepID=UPI0026E163AD|nr:amidohydrolase [Aliiglaciecola sp. 3_MG-2023]MDO6694576.1 amidohydrolase [Aliiglaciecola sp. 3_MG-2023]